MRSILCVAMQRLAASHAAETTVSVVQLPSDDMKGRIIGREGRNIRALENLTGVDFIIDDTPNAVVLSAFDGVRREIARMTLEKLLQDGRIHPARIEETYYQAKSELESHMIEAGEEAVFEADVQGLDPELVRILGRLKFRTSYGQNVLAHSVECAHLAALMASELGASAKTARRAALLHDIGKAVSHEIEGPHALVGGDLARRHGEAEAVAHAMEAHHNEVEPQTVEAVIVQAADALSGARPGARGESLEHYVKRLRDLEQLASRHEGVEKVYAMQAGREIRVIVEPGTITDDARGRALPHGRTRDREGPRVPGPDQGHGDPRVAGGGLCEVIVSTWTSPAWRCDMRLSTELAQAWARPHEPDLGDRRPGAAPQRRRARRLRLPTMSEPGHERRGRGLGALAAAAAVLVILTTVLVLVPGVHFAYRSPRGHVALETAAAVIAPAGRVPGLRALQPELGAGRTSSWPPRLAVLAVSALVFAVLPALGSGAPARDWSWARVAADLAGRGGVRGRCLLPRAAAAEAPAARRGAGAAGAVAGARRSPWLLRVIGAPARADRPDAVARGLDAPARRRQSGRWSRRQLLHRPRPRCAARGVRPRGRPAPATACAAGWRSPSTVGACLPRALLPLPVAVLAVAAHRRRPAPGVLPADPRLPPCARSRAYQRAARRGRRRRGAPAHRARPPRRADPGAAFVAGGLRSAATPLAAGRRDRARCWRRPTRRWPRPARPWLPPSAATTRSRSGAAVGRWPGRWRCVRASPIAVRRRRRARRAAARRARRSSAITREAVAERPASQRRAGSPAVTLRDGGGLRPAGPHDWRRLGRRGRGAGARASGHDEQRAAGRSSPAGPGGPGRGSGRAPLVEVALPR